MLYPLSYEGGDAPAGGRKLMDLPPGATDDTSGVRAEAAPAIDVGFEHG